MEGWWSFRGKATDKYSVKSKKISNGNNPGSWQMTSDYPLHKRLKLWKTHSIVGFMWDVVLIFLSIVACFFYVAETYKADYDAVQVYKVAEGIMTQFFLLDFIFNYLSSANKAIFFAEVWTFIDLATVLPWYFEVIAGWIAHDMLHNRHYNFSTLRISRILRLSRILNSFRALEAFHFTKANKEIITLVLTMFSLVFIAAGIFHIMENQVKQQLHFNCLYVGALTNWEPSCSEIAPFNTTDPSGCDCVAYGCQAYYIARDVRGEPSGVRCVQKTFFTCFYFMIVTVSTVGYGDYLPTTPPSRALVILFIIMSIVIIPIQVNKVVELLMAQSPFRQPHRLQRDEIHAVLCGKVDDAQRLQRFFVEYFHPTHVKESLQNRRLLILTPTDPSEDVRVLMDDDALDGRVTCLVGSSLRTDDLKRAGVHNAAVVFFFADTKHNRVHSSWEDSATSVLRIMAVNAFDSRVFFITQVLEQHERQKLDRSKVDVVFCFDQYRTAMQARNALCPGQCTLIENLFNSFQPLEPENKEGLAEWEKEYVHGASIDTYFVTLPTLYMSKCSFDWSLMVEGIYLAFGCIMIGVCSYGSHDVVLNPTSLEARSVGDFAAFFATYPVAVLLARSEKFVHKIAEELSHTQSVQAILRAIFNAEKTFGVRLNSPFGVGKFESIVLQAQFSSARLDCSWEDDRTSSTSSNLSPNMLRSLITANRPKSSLKSTRDKPKSPSVGISAIGSCTTEVGAEAEAEAGAGPETEAGAAHSEVRGPDSFAESLKALIAPQGDGEEWMGTLYVSNHIIVFGCLDNIEEFLAEVRRPLNVGPLYHAVVVIGGAEPDDWEAKVEEKFDDVFFIEGDIDSFATFEKANVRDAFSIVLLADRLQTTEIEEEFLDPKDLFAAMKLQSLLPTELFFGVELMSFSCLDILNGVSVRGFVDDESFSTGAAVRLSDTHPIRFSANKIEGSFSSQQRDHVFTASHVTGGIDRGLILHNSTAQKSSTGSFLKPGDADMETGRIDHQKNGEESGDDDGGGGAKIKSSTLASIANIPSFFPSITETQRIKPIFASGRIFVAHSFDSLLSQTFSKPFSPLLLERLVSGQDFQTMHLIDVPRPFIEKPFKDLFRALISHRIMVIGLYRSPQDGSGAILPYVYTCPKPDAVLMDGDQVYVYCNPITLSRAMRGGLETPHERRVDGTMGMATISEMAIDAPVFGQPQSCKTEAETRHPSRRSFGSSGDSSPTSTSTHGDARKPLTSPIGAPMPMSMPISTSMVPPLPSPVHAKAIETDSSCLSVSLSSTRATSKQPPQGLHAQSQESQTQLIDGRSLENRTSTAAPYPHPWVVKGMGENGTATEEDVATNEAAFARPKPLLTVSLPDHDMLWQEERQGTPRLKPQAEACPRLVTSPKGIHSAKVVPLSLLKNSITATENPSPLSPRTRTDSNNIDLEAIDWNVDIFSL